jgi:hypothetical protein
MKNNNTGLTADQKLQLALGGGLIGLGYLKYKAREDATNAIHDAMQKAINDQTYIGENMNLGVIRKIEKLLYETEYPMTDEQKMQAGEDIRQEELKKILAADAAKAVKESNKFQKMVDANQTPPPEMGDGNPFDEITNQ